MAKRFTDTNKYKKSFTRSLQGPYKLLWDYLYHDCDHSGIWIVDFEIAQAYLGRDMKIEKEKALEYFNQGDVRIVELDGGKKWFLPGFIEFQYGVLSEKNRAHISVISTLKRYFLLNQDLTLKEFKPLTSPLQGGKEKDKDKEQDKDMDKDKEGEVEILDMYPFEDFWNLYDKKRGKADTEKKYNKLSPFEKGRIFSSLRAYVASTPDPQYRKDPETYLNGKHWNDQIIEKEVKQGKIQQAVMVNQQVKEDLKKQYENE